MYKRFIWYRVPLFDYTADIPPLIYTDAEDVEYQLDSHFSTDGGSIPLVVRILPFAHLDPFNFPRSYLFHDCGYQYGGLYIRYPGEKEFKFRLLTKKQVDDLLKDLLSLENSTKYDRLVIMTGINIGSRFVWDKTKKPLKQKEERIKNNIKVYNRDGNLAEDNRIKIPSIW